MDEVMPGDLVEVDGEGLAIYLFSERAKSHQGEQKFNHWMLFYEGPDCLVSYSPRLVPVGPTFEAHRLGQVRVLSSFKEAL